MSDSETPWTEAAPRGYGPSAVPAAFARRLEKLVRVQHEALLNYTGVVQNVNRPDSFEVEVADGGGPAREALRQYESLRAELERG